MIDWLRTQSAHIVTRWRTGLRIPQIRAWAWLGTQTDDPCKKIRCLEAILALQPDLIWAQDALQLTHHRPAQAN